MTPTPKSASGVTARHAVESAKPQEAEIGPFVLNLCSSTTPMALARAEQPELKRFSFFVSRRFEEGRERFRLHMGFFATLAEAEEWLGAVRDIYPGAWAGEAPGKKLRERAVAAAAAQAQHAAGPRPATHQEPASLPDARSIPTIPVARPAAAQAQAPAGNVPTIHAAAPASGLAPTHGAVQAAAAGRNAPAAKPAPVLNSGPKPMPGALRSSTPTPAPALRSAVPTVAAAKAAPAALKAALTARSAAPIAKAHAATGQIAAPNVTARLAAAARAAATAGGARAAVSGKALPLSASPRAQGAGGAQRQSARKPTLPNSNVREVLKALDESPNETEMTGETRMMPVPLISNLAAADEAGFTDTQVLRFLESRRADGTEITGIDVETGAISLLKPDDTGTRRALKEAVADNAPVWFAVQLQWSVQPVELSKVPPLAIFSAYTLYTVEGSRDGRKWFGLRLGFFSDAISAKQVAYYVRSEFTSVAVVPVSPQERTRATEVDKKGSAALAFPKKARSEPVDEFKLIDSDGPAVPTPAHPQRVAPKLAAAGRPAQQQAPAIAKRASKVSNTVRARERRGPQTLEETLEILGAGELEVDNGSGESLNESGVRHLRVEVQKNTPFGRLLERLTERVRKP